MLFITSILFLTNYHRQLSVKEQLQSIPSSKASGDYANAQYVNAHKISPSQFTYSSNSPDNLPLSKAFDEVGAGKGSSYYWAAQYANNETFKNSIFINFKQQTQLEAILYDSAYSTKDKHREFHGFPLQLNIYSSFNGGPFELRAIFTGNAINPKDWGITQYVFRNSFLCDKLQIEFFDVSPDLSFSGGKKCPVAAEITFIGDLKSYNVPIQNKQGLYNDNNYLSSHIISTSEYQLASSGDKDGKPVTNINSDNYWVSQNENSDAFKATITITFNTVQTLQAFLMKPAYRTRNGVRNFDGFPEVLNVYAQSAAGQPLQLNTIFSGSPLDDWNIVQFVFNKPVQCKQLKLEFASVTQDGSFSGFKYHAVCGQLQLIKGASYDQLTFEPTSGNYGVDNYIRKHLIPQSNFTYKSNVQHFDNYPISNLFDEQANTYWCSQS